MFVSVMTRTRQPLHCAFEWQKQRRPKNLGAPPDEQKELDLQMLTEFLEKESNRNAKSLDAHGRSLVAGSSKNIRESKSMKP